ncbi:MAG: transketolase [Nitrospirae bacterium]|nr:transketolase [Nitrospirota bacterium]
MPEKDLDTLCINTLRMLAVDMVEKANSGHPGICMGAAPMAYALWTRVMKHNPKDPAWPDRDRFVLSAGHGSALLYSLLHLTGYESMTMEQLKAFRQWGSITPGHPESELAKGVEVTTGPLGQGLANAVGLAVAERSLAARFNRPGFEIVDHFTYTLCGDGDLMEGVASEAASLAGHLGLGRLICLYDNNRVSLAASTKMTFTEDVAGRFAAYGWHVQRVRKGNDAGAVEKALLAAKAEGAKPSIIIVDTHIGYGSPHMQDSFEAHGSPLGPDETIATKKNLGWPAEAKFHIPAEALKVYRSSVKHGEKAQAAWEKLFARYAKKYPAEAAEWSRFMSGRLPEGWDSDVPVYTPDHKPVATRTAGGEIMNALAKRVPNLIGGSADLDPSTKTALKGMGSFQAPGTGDDTVQGSQKGPWGYGSPNVAFGVREHGMGGILNGMAAHGGLIPYGSTFLVFSDYMRPSMRLAALAGLHVLYVFTHDSVSLGEDGPTHQPVEHVASLRAMPGMTVIRPADASETAEAWKAAMTRKAGPVSLVMSRQDLKITDRTRYAPASGLASGAYVLAGPKKGRPDAIIIATGSEVGIALDAYETLSAEGIRARVVSMPSWELFEEQPERYRMSVMPPEVTARVSVEAGATFGWERYVGSGGVMLGIDRFGASAPVKANMEKFGFTADNIVKAVKRLLGL